MKAIHELGVLSPSANGRGLQNRKFEMCPKNSDFLLGINRLSLALRHDLCTAKKNHRRKLERVGKAEQILRNSGFKQFRVRIHGDIARIELLPEDFEKMLKMREELYASIKGSWIFLCDYGLTRLSYG